MSEENEIVFEGKVFALYSQIALFDAEKKDAYPQWKAGKEIIVFGLSGVVVVTAGDKLIDVVVCKGKVVPQQYALCISGEIIVGNQGIIIGNVPAANVTQIPMQSGRYSVVIFTDGIGSNTNKVFFYVDYLNKKI